MQGYFKDTALVLDTYKYICCLAGIIIDLAHLRLLLFECPYPLIQEHCQIVQE